MALACAPRTFAGTNCNSFTGSHDRRTRNGLLEGLKTTRVQQLLCFPVLTSQEWRFGAVPNRQDETV
eukprot:2558725-Pyramimonas_sp.AAC.1